MRIMFAAVLAAAVLPAQADTIYRCGSGGEIRYQDRPCANGTEVQRGGYVQPSPAPGASAADHYKAYLDTVKPAPDSAPAARTSAAAPSEPPQTETQRRAVFVCNADQRTDELRNGYASYSCDQRTGEKKLVERQTIIVDRDGRSTRP